MLLNYRMVILYTAISPLETLLWYWIYSWIWGCNYWRYFILGGGIIVYNSIYNVNYKEKSPLRHQWHHYCLYHQFSTGLWGPQVTKTWPVSPVSVPCLHIVHLGPMVRRGCGRDKKCRVGEQNRNNPPVNVAGWKIPYKWRFWWEIGL